MIYWVPCENMLSVMLSIATNGVNMLNVVPISALELIVLHAVSFSERLYGLSLCECLYAFSSSECLNAICHYAECCSTECPPLF